MKTYFLEKRNNSIKKIIPYFYIIHAVKAVSDDLSNQRTNLFGNICFKDIYKYGRKLKYLYSTFIALKY